MGIIIGKLRRKKTTVEVLETLDKEIKTIEQYRVNTEEAHKRIVGRFIIISVGIYLVSAFLFYFYFFPATFYDQLFYIIPLILAPVIILTVKRVLTWYYKWKISRKQNKLTTLRDEKKKMLDKVMETETYKIAKSILEKFAEPTFRKSSAILASSEYLTPLKPLNTSRPSNTEVTGGLRQRALPPMNQQLVPTMTPGRPMMKSVSSTVLKPEFARTPIMHPPSSGMPVTATSMVGTPLPMPRAILPRERSVFDKMVDYLVGDGPTNRYALICSNCFSHNGMAFREEFEYISFRCCYCFTFNPARKKRPLAPKLEFDLKSPHIQNLSDTSESEKNSPSDTESESETIGELKSTEIQEVLGAPEDARAAESLSDLKHEDNIMDVDVSLEKLEETFEQVESGDIKVGRVESGEDVKDVFDVEKVVEQAGGGIVKD